MESRFLAKNSSGDARGRVFKCEVSTADGKESIVCKSCPDPEDDSIPNDPYLPKFMPPTTDNSPPRNIKSQSLSQSQIIASQLEIRKLLAAAKSQSTNGQKRLGRNFNSGNANAANDGRRNLPKWIEVDNTKTLSYQFLVINNDESHVDYDKLESIINALQKNCDENLKADYGVTADFEVIRGSLAMNNPEHFQGDRIIIFIGRYGQGMFHYADVPEPANSYSFPVGGGALKDYKIDLPAGSDMNYVPYSIISSDSIPDFISEDANVYGVSNSSLLTKAKSNPGLNVKIDEFYQVLSMGICHEVFEIVGNDTTLNWVLFDHYAPTVAYWHWGEFTNDKSFTPQCTNGKLNKDTTSPNYGYRELPMFLDQFPSGGLIFCVHEVGDVVSAGFAGLLNSYVVDGWLMINYPLMSFWKPYNHDSSITGSSNNPKYDKLGYVKRPLEPYGGMHQLSFFISFDDGKTRYVEIQNKGPVTADLRGAPPQNNFPPDYVYVRQLGLIAPGMNVVSMIESIENYGPSKADKS